MESLKEIPSFSLFALICTIQKRDDLSAGAAIGGTEGGGCRAVGHAVLHGPGHSVSTERISRHIGKAVDHAGSRTQRAVPQRFLFRPGCNTALLPSEHPLPGPSPNWHR